MSFGLLFPGQGAQFVGMGKDLAEGYPAARARFEEADALLGCSLSRLCWEGPPETLTRTEHCQPALYVCSLAALAALEAELGATGKQLVPRAAAGLSLGEYTALAAAGAVSFQDGLRLVQLRGRAMEEAAQAQPGTMASILGLEREPVEAICSETGAEVANLNAPGQIVVSGEPSSVQAAVALARERGAKRAVPLAVSGAFHSRLMEPAAARLKEVLASVEIRPARYPVLSNVTGAPHGGPEETRSRLVEQLTRPVQWEACLRTILQGGTRTFLEVGPGTVLKGLLRRIEADAQVLSVGTAEQAREAAAVLLASADSADGP